jgi:4-hydroxyphenylpyruvate dioxygenase-like putative hemolysin
MAALMLAVLAFGSSIDAYVCRAEAIPPATASSSADEAAQHAEALHAHAFPSEHDDGEGPCVHGHCHHAIFFVDTPPVQIGQAGAVPQRLSPRRTSVALSDLQFGLMRPPRA